MARHLFRIAFVTACAFVIAGFASAGGLAGPALEYSSDTFTERVGNDGSINGDKPLIITLENPDAESFTGADGDDLVAAGAVWVANLPDGLSAVIKRASALTLEVTLTGSHAPHTNAEDVGDLTFGF